jgi:hypothetical protein
MATTKSTTSRGTAAKPRASRPANKSLPARTGRTIKERPYTSAAIATGAITAVAAAAAGAFFFSRRDKSLRETGEDLTNLVKDGFADATSKFKEFVASDAGSNSGKTQQEIAEEALTLKETGASASPVDALASDQIKTGSVAY